jgi:hypothetical protein
MNVAPGTYAITVNAAEANAPTGDNVEGSTSFTITVGQEAAMATYSGSQVFSTSSPSSGSYTINLAATIQDVGGSGEKAGNITHATVTFVNRDANNAPLSGCVNLPVGLVSSSDTTTGSASCTTSGTLTSSQMSYGGTSFALGIIVGYNANGTNLTGYTGDNGWYTDNSSAEDAVLTITVPLSSNVANGGGWILLQHSSGQDAGDANSHNNFGMTFKYNKGGTNPQGHFNAIFLHTVNGVVHTYQIQSNSISSFSVDTTKGTASINTKASLTDITNPGSPVSVDGGALLTINVTKTTSSFPGSIGIQLNSKSGGIYYSSNWTGATTSQTTLGGGHLTVS